MAIFNSYVSFPGGSWFDINYTYHKPHSSPSDFERGRLFKKSLGICSFLEMGNELNFADPSTFLGSTTGV